MMTALLTVATSLNATDQVKPVAISRTEWTHKDWHQQEWMRADRDRLITDLKFSGLVSGELASTLSQTY